MNATEFINNVASQFDETPKEEITMETEFRSIKEWSSMIALSIMAMADEEYGVALKGEHLSQAHTIKDIYNKVEELQAK
jgi:acyl carrier protein